MLCHKDCAELNRYKVVTAWIPLHKITEQNGALQFAAGSHLDGFISDRPMEAEDVDKAYFNEYVANKGFKVSIMCKHALPPLFALTSLALDLLI